MAQSLHPLVVTASRLLTAIPAMIKLKITAANSSKPQYWPGMAQNADEIAAIVICDDSLECFLPANERSEFTTRQFSTFPSFLMSATTTVLR